VPFNVFIRYMIRQMPSVDFDCIGPQTRAKLIRVMESYTPELFPDSAELFRVRSDQAAHVLQWTEDPAA